MDIPRSFAWRPHTTAILLGGFAIILIALSISFMVNSFAPKTSVHVGSGFYDVDLANTDAARNKGLAGIDDLGVNGGLLMDFKSSGEWGIWMKGMKVPIDIIWLDQGKKVIYIKKGANPSTGTTVTYTPKSPARYVLELPAGSVDKSAIQIGQVAQFTLKEDQE